MTAFVVGVAALLLLLTAEAHGENSVKVPFLFTEDQNAPQSDFGQAIKPSEVLSADPYLNAPITRLEYMLTRMEQRLNEENTLAVIKDGLEKRFEIVRQPLGAVRIQGYARYAEQNGRVVVGYVIERLERPRSPMRDACNEVLSGLKWTVPQQNLGFLLPNTVLGVLMQKGDLLAYAPTMQKLASHIVHRVNISSESADLKVHHIFRCQRTAVDEPITYDKASFSVK